MQMEAEAPPPIHTSVPSLLILLFYPTCLGPHCLLRILPLRLSPGKTPLCKPAKALLPVLLALENLVAPTWGGVCPGAFVQPWPLFRGLVCLGGGGSSEGNTGSRWDPEKILEDLEQVQKENSSRTS